jgi:hypothetical protein
MSGPAGIAQIATAVGGGMPYGVCWGGPPERLITQPSPWFPWRLADPSDALAPRRNSVNGLMYRS